MLVGLTEITGHNDLSRSKIKPRWWSEDYARYTEDSDLRDSRVSARHIGHVRFTWNIEYNSSYHITSVKINLIMSYSHECTVTHT